MSAELGEGLPRAINRWYVFGSILLLRASVFSGRSTAIAEPKGWDSSLTRQSDHTDQSVSHQAFGAVSNLASDRIARVVCRELSTGLSIPPQRVVERIHHLAVHTGEKPLRRSRDSECDRPDLWVDEMIRTWDSLQPTQHHLPIPQKVLHGMLAVCIAWSWPKIGILLVLGFYGLLRPIELLSLRRKDVVLPTEHLEGEVIFLRIHTPKTRFRGAAAQHVRIDSVEAVAFVNQFLPKIPRWQSIWSGSYAAFRRRFDLLQTAVVLGKPFMPSSLRPGGATFLFRHWNENLPRLQWRGRWKSFRMLETYIQELGAAEVLAAFSPVVLSRVVVLHDFFEALIA